MSRPKTFTHAPPSSAVPSNILEINALPLVSLLCNISCAGVEAASSRNHVLIRQIKGSMEKAAVSWGGWRKERQAAPASLTLLSHLPPHLCSTQIPPGLGRRHKFLFIYLFLNVCQRLKFQEVWDMSEDSSICLTLLIQKQKSLSPFSSLSNTFC